MDAVVRCLQRSCCGRGRGKNSRENFRGKLGCANSRHAWIRVSLCTTTVPSRGTVVIRHQSTRRALCAHLVCFASSCATAQIPSSDNTDDTQYLHAYFSFVSIHSFDPNSSWNFSKKEAEFLLVQYIYIYKNRKLFSPALLWKTYIRRGEEKKEKRKTFHPSFIHVLVITSISISRRISNSRSRMYIGYKDASVSVQRAAPVANIKQGRGGPVCAGAPRENRGVYIHAYVCMYMHPRYETHWTTLWRGQTAAVETVCPANWFSLASSIRRPRNPLRAPSSSAMEETSVWSSIDRSTHWIEYTRFDYPGCARRIKRGIEGWTIDRSLDLGDLREIGGARWIMDRRGDSWRIREWN